MGKWGKWVLLFFVAMAFAVPAWAVDLKLGGKYEIQGRYYTEKDVRSTDDNDCTPVTTMYMKHYFNLYPTLTVTDKIAIKGDLEVFDNVISKKDSYYYGDKSSSIATQAPYDQYSTFTVNELYVDATTDYGKIIAGKLRQFSGIGWFIQVPQVPDWTFGLIYNKENEGYDKQSYEGYDSDTLLDGSDNPGAITNHDNADETHYILVANYAKDAIDFKGTLAYKHTGHSDTRTRIWYPFAYFNYAISPDLTFNSKFGFADGPLLQKDSNVAKELVALAVDELVEQGQAALAFVIDNNYATGLAEDWEADKQVGLWLGMGYKMDALKLQVDGAWMPGADAPNKISAYMEDWENLDTWLMNDVSDLYGLFTQTPATISALGDPRWDGNFSFANAILARLNLAYKFTPKLDGNLNFVWGQMENTDYLKNYATAAQAAWLPAPLSDLAALYAALSTIDPDAMQVGGTGIVYEGATVLPAPEEDFSVSADMGWEVRARLNYALQDNLILGLDLCYYQPGDLYKDLIETAFIDGFDTGYKLENTYAARWKMTVKF